MIKNIIVFMLISISFSTVSLASDSAVEMWTLWSDSMIWNSDVWVNQDWSIDSENVSIDINNVVAWDTQVTDKQVVAWDQVINMWAETNLSPINEEEIDLNSAWLEWENNAAWVTMWNVEVDKLPTTWLEESFLIIISLLISWLLIFRNKFFKK